MPCWSRVSGWTVPHVRGIRRRRGDAASFTVVSVDRDGQCRYRVAGELTRQGLTATGELRPRRSPRRTEPPGDSRD